MVYLITFRCYGTWLHGDERGSVDRFNNQPGEPLIGPNERLRRHRRRLMSSGMVHLNDPARECVRGAIREVASYRGWTVLALNVLSNHVHAVIGCDDDVRPEKILSDLKARATRRLRVEDLAPDDVPVWEHHGSTRYLKSEISVSAACDYVLNQQETHSEPRA